MAMTEKSRAALYQGLSTVVSEEAVGEMLSYFPARDVEEPASKEFIDRRFVELEVRFAEIDARFAEIDARFAQVDVRFAQVDARFAQVDARLDELGLRIDHLAAGTAAGFERLEHRLEAQLERRLRTVIQWNVGTVLAVFGLLVALRVVT